MTAVLLPSSVDHMLALIRDGATLEEAAADIGVTGRTIYRRVKRDAALRDRLTDAQRVRDEAATPAGKPTGSTESAAVRLPAANRSRRMCSTASPPPTAIGVAAASPARTPTASRCSRTTSAA